MKTKKNWNIKNSFRIAGLVALVAMVITFSGCVGQDAQKTATSPQTESVSTPGPSTATTTSPQTVATTNPTTSSDANTATATTSSSASPVPPDSIIQQADVPTLTFSQFNYASAPKDKEFIYSGSNSGRAAKTRAEIVPSYREVGQASSWVSLDQSSLSFQMSVFDTSEGNGKDIPDQLTYCASAVCGSEDIGDISYYHSDPSGSGIEITTLTFVKGEYYVMMTYQGKTGTSLSETIRIARAVEGRLKPKFPSQTFPKADTGSNLPSVSIIKPADAPELHLGSFYYLLAKAGQEFNYSAKDTVMQYSTNANSVSGVTYKTVGQSSQWFDKDQQATHIQVLTFETNVGNGDDLPKLLSECKHVFCGSVNIGEKSFYYTDPWDNPKSPTLGQTTLYFSKGSHFVTIKISGKNGANSIEATRLAGIVESRLQ